MRTAKTILTVILLTFPILMSNAKSKKNLAAQQQLVGIWQSYGTFEGAPETDRATRKPDVDLTKHKPNGDYKVFGESGDFYAFQAATPATMRVWENGSYEVVAAGKYVEHIGFHTDPAIVGRSVEMSYAFLSEDQIVTTHETPSGIPLSEVWKRISPTAMASIKMSNSKNKTAPETLHKFSGLWQNYGGFMGVPPMDPVTQAPDIDITRLRPGNYYKTFGRGREFNAFSVYSPTSVDVWINGSIEVVSDDRYTEHVGFHSNPDFAGRPVELSYVFFSEGNYYFISTYERAPGLLASEIWRRISPPEMAPVNRSKRSKGSR